jgi:glucose/arabinose dehydrogenase
VSRAGATAVTLALTVTLAITACTTGEPDDGAGPTPDRTPGTPTAPAPDTPAATPRLTGDSEVIATGLAVPWDIAFLPDGAALVTERTTGRIIRVGPERDGSRPRTSVVQTIPGVNAVGEGGLLGIAVSPRYDEDGTIFVYYSTAQDNRIARLALGGTPEPILTGIPVSGNHNGGRLAFGPDGYLYATTGDAAQRSRSQDRDNLAGKILRMTADGDPAPGNPFGSHVWAYGLRNPQGLAWDGDDRLWATEFGENRWDEINLIEPGRNYGWPEVEGPGGEDPYTGPAVWWQTQEASCSGAAVVGTTLVAACLRGQRLWLMELGGGPVPGTPEPLLVEVYGRLRAATVAPDGSLWVSTSNRDNRLRGGPGPDDDRIIRLAATGGGDQG